MEKVVFVQEHKIGLGSAISRLNLGWSQHLAKRGFKSVVIDPINISRFVSKKSFSQRKTSQRTIKSITQNQSKILIINIGFHYKALARNFLKGSIKANSPYFIWCHVNLDNDYRQKDTQYLSVKKEHRYYLNHNLCQGVFCCSKNVAKSLGSIVADREKIHIVYPLVKIRQKTGGIKCQKGDLLFVGRLSPEKNARLLVKAAKALLRTYPALKLNIVGEGPEKEGLQALAKSLKLEKNIRFLPFLPHVKILQLIQNHKIVCLPSLTESFGMVLTEAMLQETPVIGSNVEGIKEITNNGKYGLLFEKNSLSDLTKKISWGLENYPVIKKRTIEAKDYLQKKYSRDKQLFILENVILHKSFLSPINLPIMRQNNCPVPHMN